MKGLMPAVSSVHFRYFSIVLYYKPLCIHIIIQSLILIMLKTFRFFFSGKKLFYSEDIKAIINKTTSTVQNVAAITLGPYGRNVLIQNEMQEPRITKDGITVLKHLQFENRMEDAVCTLVKKSVDGTNKYAGDGTTTSTILIGEIMKEAMKKVATGESSREIRKGLEIGRKISLQFLQSCCRKIQTKQDLIKVAMISTNGKRDISELIAEAVHRSSSVSVEKSNKFENSVEYYSGMKMTRGFESQDFVNTSKGKVIYNYPFVVVSNLPIRNVKEIVNILELAKKARKQVILFAPDFSDSVKSTLIYNMKKKIVEASCISVPPYGDIGKQMLPKIAKMTEATFYDEFSGQKIDEIGWNNFGKAVKVQSDQFETKLQVLEKQGKKTMEAVIFVGGPNQTAMLENYDHIIDALNSVTSAKKDGVVAGGGVAMWRLAQLLKMYTGEGEVGVRILAHALEQPRRKLNQYIAYEKKPLSGEMWEGLDLKSGKIVDMFEAGIIDSVNVAKSTIIDSISLCTVLVEVEVGIGRESRNLSSVSLKQLNKKYSL